MSEEQEYLSPAFDPATLTVPRLRNILVTHNISYPASAKKPQLVELFNQHIVPQAQKLLGARSRDKRSAKGIVDVPSSQDNIRNGVVDDGTVIPSLLAPPQAVPSSLRRTSRRTAALPVDSTPLDILPAGLSNGRSSGKRTRHSEQASGVQESVKEASSRKIRHGRAEPALEEEAVEPEAWKKRGVDSPFSSDNPFQSGSSPAEARSVSGERRRKTLGSAVAGERRKSDDLRRKTDNYQLVSQASSDLALQRQRRDMPMARARREPSPEEAVEAGEDFTPEEQLELVRERAKTGEMDILPPRRRRPKKASGLLQVATSAMSLAMLGGLGFVWRQEKLEVGYCGVGRPSSTFAGVQLPEWATFVQPQCEPCPQHAYCYKNLQTVCEPGFVMTPHPLSLGAIMPLPPTCEPDGEKARRVKAVADRAVEELRERNAKWECGELIEKDGKQASAVELEEHELKQEVSTKRRKGMSQEEFEDLWAGAIGEILGRDEVVIALDGTSGHHNLRSTSLSHVPLGCAIRRAIRLALVRHLWKLVVVLCLISSGAYTRFSITSGRETESKAKQLASLALDRLYTQAALNAQDPEHYLEAGISMGQLRDDVLREEFSASRRQKLWERVQKKVEQNSNVRPMVRAGRSGDISRVWEWIGPVGALEDSRSVNRRKSSRYSLGPVEGSSPVRMSLVPAGEHDIKKEMSEKPHWDEGRPIY